MRKDTTSTIKRAERFQIILIGEGILVGGIGGLVVLLYRIMSGIRRQMAEYDSGICQAKPDKNCRMVPDPDCDGVACRETGEL